MAIKGKICYIGTEVNGVTKAGKNWRKKLFVMETFGQYPKKVAFHLMNDKIDTAGINLGDVVETEIDASSREYQGKWYTELTAWGLKNLGQQSPMDTGAVRNVGVYEQQAPQGYEATVQKVVPNSNNNDPLPF